MQEFFEFTLGSRVLYKVGLARELGEEAWNQGMHPEIPETKILDNPYQYTEFRSSATHGSRDTAETAG